MSSADHLTDADADSDQAFWDSPQPAAVWAFAAAVAALMILIAYVLNTLAGQ
jgi:hypothetical protein